MEPTLFLKRTKRAEVVTGVRFLDLIDILHTEVINISSDRYITY